MLGEQIVNPISMAFSIAEAYHELLKATLDESGLDEKAIGLVLEKMEDVGVDNQLIFSVNKMYKLDDQPFGEFCRHYLSEALLRVVHRSAPEAKRIKRLYEHQAEGIKHIVAGKDTVIATGTGSGKTETFLFPIVEHCLKNRDEGVKALIVYPMNALANDQLRRLGDLVGAAHAEGLPLRYGSFTGLTPKNYKDALAKHLPTKPLAQGHVLFRDDMRQNPPDILITNYVMLDRMLTLAGERGDRQIFERSAQSLRFVVLDELHTYRGNTATHLRGLLRRLVHAIGRRPVFVGTSATLTSGTGKANVQAGDGYLAKAMQSDIDAFVKPLFDASAYEITLPTYAETETPTYVQPMPNLHDLPGDGWALDFDIEKGLKNLSKLTGKRYIEEDLDSEKGRRPQALVDLAENTFIVALAERLRELPLTFNEVVDVLRPLLPEGYGDPVLIAKAYLSAVAFVNQFAQGDALLDFRIHLFLKNLDGHLQLCVRCCRYHSGTQEICGECGWPLFKASRADVREAVGKVAHRELRRQVCSEPDDPRFTYLTRIKVLGGGEQDVSQITVSDGDRLTFDESSPGSNQGVCLTHAERGALVLHLIPRTSYEQPQDLVIPLVSRRKDHQYIANMIETILRSQHRNDRKLLGFIDNREAASRYVSVLGDEFAGQYFEDVLSIYKSELGMHDLPSALKFVIDRFEEEMLSEEEQTLARDFPAWVSRAVSQSPRKGQNTHAEALFMLKPPTDAMEFSDLHLAILDLFFDERAIDKRFLGQFVPELDGKEAPPGILRAQRYLIGWHYGVHLGDAGTSGKRFSAISLGERARTHRELIEQHGVAKLHEAVRSLVDDGTSPHLPLVQHVVSDSSDGPDVHYYLKPTWVRFAPPDNGLRDYGDVRDRLLRGGLHSSDVLDERRAEAEDCFQKGRLDFLLATPTLEMGVDIGQLKNVLLIGVPPLPSNYAQRAGRAGRGRKDRYALIVTFCSDSSNHDQYYFDRPREMVAGYISPPSFDPTNAAVLTKHIHALILRHWVEDSETFLALAAQADELLPLMANEAHQVFGDIFGAHAYVLGPFREQLQTFRRKVERSRVRPLQLFYNTNDFPDYGFRRDEVVVLDKKRADEEGVDFVGAHRRYEEGVLDREDQKVFDRLRVSGRHPEQAYYRLFPGETVSMAGDDFVIGMDSPFYQVVDAHAKSYNYLYGYRSDDLLNGSRTQKRERQTWLTADSEAVSAELAGLVRVTHHPCCTISFRMIAEGSSEKADGQDPTRGETIGDNAPFAMGYDLKREALSLSFPRNLFADNRLAVSFLSALDRAVKDAYGLDEGDLRLIIDLSMTCSADRSGTDAIDGHTEASATDAFHAVLYDSSGNGNAPLARVYRELMAEGGALRRAYDQLVHCPNESCIRGCYLCTRSYSTHFYSGDVDRSAARMVVGYLLGENAFEPTLPLPPNISPGGTDVALQISLQDGMATVTGAGRSFTVDASMGQNDALFAALAFGAEAVYEDGCQGLRVIVTPSVNYLTPFINERHIGKKAKRKEKAAFERTIFNLLRFQSVRAVDHASL